MNKFLLLCSFFVMALLILDKAVTDTTKNNNQESIIGAILDYDSRVGKEESVAMKIALDDFSSYSNQSLALYMRNSQSKPLQALLAVRDLIITQRVQAIIGTQTWEEASLVAEIGSDNHVPFLSLADATPTWATERWPFLVEASSNQFNQIKAIASIIHSWGWYKISVIYQDRDFSATTVLPHLADALKEVGSEISQYVAIPPLDSTLLSNQLRMLKRGQSRVFVVHMRFELAMRLFERADKMNMIGKDYVWITTNPFTNLVDSFNASIISTLQGVVGIKSYFAEHINYPFQEFYRKFRKRFSSEFPEEDSNEPSFFAVQAYDAITTVALAISKSNENKDHLLEIINVTNFDGLSGKIQFDNRKLPPTHVFQIINVMGKSYMELGFWSEESGFTKTLDKNSPKYSSMKGLGQVFWPGGPWFTPKGWTVSSDTNPLRIGVPVGAMFKEYADVQQDDEQHSNISFTGYAIDVFKATVACLPFYLPYQFFPFNGTYDDLVRQIYLKKFDAVVGDVKIISSRWNYAEFTQPYSEPGLVMVVPVQSNTRKKGYLFIKPFTGLMWFLIALVNIINATVLWAIERKYRSANTVHHPNSETQAKGNWLSLPFISLIVILPAHKMNANASRITMVVWLLVALVITQIYTANLASMLTTQRLEPTVSDVETLKANNDIVGYCNGTFIPKFLTDVLGFQPKNIRNFTSPHEYADALRRREIAAAFLEASVAKLFLAMFCKGYAIAGPTYKVGGFGFAFPKGSSLVQSVSEALLKVSESGKLMELENNMVSAQNCQEMQVEDENPGLSANSFWVLFILTGVTSLLTLLAYKFRDHIEPFCQATFLQLVGPLQVICNKLCRNSSNKIEIEPSSST